MPSFTSDERQLLDDSLRDYFKNKYSFEASRKLTNATHADGFDRGAWADYAELGWLGVNLPETAGGSSGGMTELAIVMAAAGGALALEPLLGTVVLGVVAIELVGTNAQRELLSVIAAGGHTLAFCHTETDAGYARDYVTTNAESDGDGFVLNGEKGFALHTQAADTLLVSARLGGASGPLSLFLVPRESEGVHVKPAPALDGRRGGAVALNRVRVTKAARLGGGDADMSMTIDTVLDRGVIAVCAEACGAMHSVTELTVEYLKSREQFGQPLSKFQVLQHRLVDMSVSTEEARAATHGALKALDSGSADAQTRVWRAKVQMGRSARFVGGQAVQLHGGIGMTDELAIGHYYKRLSMCEAMFGDAEWYLKRLADKAR
jgi:alkylation response protein AidB-like acyl-CoA dehydrogenase